MKTVIRLDFSPMLILISCKRIKLYIATIALLLVASTLNAQIYVDIDATGNNDGSSWADAYTDLQDALVSTNPGDDIWVAEGTYKPSAYPQGCSGCSSPADYTFFIKDGVRLYGGFNGTETSLDERDGAPALLDGNIPDSGPVTNVNHVVVIYANGSNTRIEGFFITGGNAGENGGSFISVFGESVDPGNGGGVYAIGQFGGSPSPKVIIAGNEIILNLASNNGGGVYIDNVPTSLESNVIYQNEANNNGGGVYSSSLDGNSTIIGNSIFDNKATNDSGVPNYGGGLYVTGTATHLIDGNSIIRNEADFGAGICMDNSSVTLLENDISKNEAFYSGGGIYGLNTSYTLFLNEVFSNIAFDRGGGILFDLCSGEIINNTITSNFSANCQGADEICFSSNLEGYLINPSNYGEPEIVFQGGSSTFFNNIVWGGGIFGNADLTVGNSIIEGGFSGQNILDEDPMFISPAEPNDLGSFISSEDLRLQSASPAIDWGDTTRFEIIAGQLNIDTSSYIVGQIIDSGAFEQEGNKFILAPNGVTCLCPDAEIGESGTLVIGGVEKTFTKVSEDNLYNLAAFFYNPIPDAPNLGLYCTSGITDMSGLFVDNLTGTSNSFNQDISSWDVSTVTNMDDMFNGATAFNQDISDWCVEAIETEPANFIDSSFPTSFKPNWGGDCQLSNFNVAPNGVTCLCPSAAIGESGLVIIDGVYKTFTKRSRAQLDALIANNDNDPRLAFTCTTGITDMSNLFGGASSFNKDISSWDVSSVTNMDNMFRNATTFNQDISFWDVSNVTSVSAIFKNASSFNQPLNDWDVSSVTEMGGMFDQALAFNQPLNNWYVSSVTNMGNMFSGATSFNQNISSWCVEQITSEPFGFATSTPAWSLPKPNWGVVCPCIAPTSLAVANITNTTANLFWTASVTETDGYDFLLQNSGTTLPSGSTPPTGNVGTGITTANLINLTEDTTYDVYVRTNCGSGNLSDWSVVESFTTDSNFTLAPNGVTCFCPDATIGDSGNLVIGGETKTFTKRTRAQLDALIAANQADPEIALTCTSGITDMSNVFLNRTTFNQNISSWDVSNVTNMQQMFRGASTFNQPLNDWDVSNVINMSIMFFDAIAFNQPLNDWNVSQVTDMFAMFQDTEVFNQPLNNWNVANVTSMNGMFYDAPVFNYPLDNWNVSSVTNMRFMFGGFDFQTTFNQPLNDWDVSQVTDMTGMFRNNIGFNKPLDNWDVSSVTNMSFMFFDATSFDQSLNGWDVSQVTDMSGMFQDAEVFNQPLNNWNVANVTNMFGMFFDAPAFNHPLDNWDVSSVTNMDSMFGGFDFQTTFNEPLNVWDTSSVTDMDFMFQNNINFNQPLNDWDTSSVTTMSYMFFGASVFNQDISRWCVENITSEPVGFSSNSPLQSSFKPLWGTCTLFFLDPNGVTCSCLNADFGDSGTLVIGGISKTFTKRTRTQLDALIANDQADPQIALTCTSGITDMSNLFLNKTLFNQDISSWDVSNVTTMSSMFSFANAFNQPLNDWDVSKLTDMNSMFRNSNFNQPLNNLDVSNVTDMQGMFFNASAFNQPLNDWDVSYVTNMGAMFRNNSDFNQPLHDWDVSQVTDMSFMFLDSVFNQDLSSWCVKKIPSEPALFSIGSPLLTSFKPNWGIFGSTCSFVYKNSSWSPNHPLTGTITSTSSNLIKIVNGTAILNGELLAKDLIINSGANLDLGSSAIINLNGDMRNDGTLTFGSDSSGSAQLDTFEGTISGNGDLTIERFIPAGDNNKRAYRLLTSAVNSTGSIYENWQENGSTPSSPDGLGTHITGGLASDGFDQSGSNNPSMFTFDNTNANGTANQTDDWSALPNTNIKSLKAGEAYLTFVRGDRSIDLTTSTSTPTNTTLRATGALYTGSLTYSVGNPVSYLNLSGEDEFYSLIGNPYQAVVDFNAATKSGLTDFIYVWDASVAGANGRGGYVTVDVTGNTTPPNPFSSDANQYLAPGMSFFVQNDNNSGTSASLTFDEDDKMTDETEITVFNTYPHFYINSRLHETLELQNGNTESDAIGLRFSDNFTTIADDEDATKLFNPGENYAIINNGLRSIDKQAIPAIGDEIDLTIINYEESNYSLTFVMENKPTGLGVFLVDNYLNTQTELTESFVYDFAVDANIPESTASDRFSLVFDNTTLGVDENSFGEGFSLFPNPAKDGQFSIKTPNLSGEVKVKLNNIMGQIVLKETLTIVGSEVNVNANNLVSGVYIVELTQDEQTFSTKLIVE